MTTAEINEVHETLQREAILARTMMNIGRRAASLWEDGYSLAPIVRGEYVDAFAVTSPVRNGKRARYTVKVTALPLHPTYGNRCSCHSFEQHSTCKHLQAVLMYLEEEKQIDAQAALEEERGWAIHDMAYSRF